MPEPTIPNPTTTESELGDRPGSADGSERGDPDGPEFHDLIEADFSGGSIGVKVYPTHRGREYLRRFELDAYLAGQRAIERVRDEFQRRGELVRAEELAARLAATERESAEVSAEIARLGGAWSTAITDGKDPAEIEAKIKDLHGKLAGLQGRIPYLRAAAAKAGAEGRPRLRAEVRAVLCDLTRKAEARLAAAEAALVRAVGPALAELALVQAELRGLGWVAGRVHFGEVEWCRAEPPAGE